MASVIKCQKLIGIYYNPIRIANCLLSSCRNINTQGNPNKSRSLNLEVNSTVNITSIQRHYWTSKQTFHNVSRTNQYSTSAQDNEPPHPRRTNLPQLMSFPKIVWPSVFKSIKNWIMINFIVRPYFDNEFNLAEFTTGAKFALQVMRIITVNCSNSHSIKYSLFILGNILKSRIR